MRCARRCIEPFQPASSATRTRPEAGHRQGSGRSLDVTGRLIAGPNDGPGNPLGGGGRLFDRWSAGTDGIESAHGCTRVVQSDGHPPSLPRPQVKTLDEPAEEC